MKPRIHLLALGGTIATQLGVCGMKVGLGAEDLLRMAPGLDAIADVEAETVSRVGSSSIALDDIYALAARIQAMADQRMSEGVIVTQGTDTLEETAFLLDAIAKGSRGRFYRDIVVYHDQVGETDALRARKYARGFGRVLALYDYPRGYLVRCVIRPALRAALGLASLNLRLARYKMLWALGVYEGYTGRLWVKQA